MDDLIRLSSNISEAIGSLNLFPTSQINVGLGNTLISMTFFGVGPSVVAYTALKILEENDKTKTVIPFSHPATFPVAAFAMNRLFNLSLSSLCCLGLLYVGFQYLRNNQFPAQAAVGFNNVMSAVTSFFNKAIQRSRYSVTEMGAIINYVVYLPQGVMREQVRVVWSVPDDQNISSKFSVLLENNDGVFTGYVECVVPYHSDVSKVVVSFTETEEGNELHLCIPRIATKAFSLHVY